MLAAFERFLGPLADGDVGEGHGEAVAELDRAGVEPGLQPLMFVVVLVVQRPAGLDDHDVLVEQTVCLVAGHLHQQLASDQVSGTPSDHPLGGGVAQLPLEIGDAALGIADRSERHDARQRAVENAVQKRAAGAERLLRLSAFGDVGEDRVHFVWTFVAGPKQRHCIDADPAVGALAWIEHAHDDVAN